MWATLAMPRCPGLSHVPAAIACGLLHACLMPSASQQLNMRDHAARVAEYVSSSTCLFRPCVLP